jgi:outer membrane protein assembly factor BamB
MNVGAVGSRTQSHSYLVGLDLSKQGSLLAGFPLHLNEAEFPGGEFDGPPLVWGEWLLVAIAERDNVGLRRRIAAFDRFSGEIIWKSPVVAVGTVAGTDRASLISHQLLSYEGGRLFYNSNLGSISCLDPLTGATLWQVQYSSTASSQRRFPTADRFRYRDLTPCLLSGGLLYCAPQDSPEIFALDASTGDLVWSSDAAQVADAVHLLGVHEDCLVVSGDRIVWLDKHSGRVRGRFPASTTPGPANALPSPRGLGRGTISAGRVFWPVAGEIFVFPASLPASPSAVENPPILNRMALDTRGSEGGNLMFAHEWMIFASPSRLMAFSPPQH